jgi:hypothetical protein
MAFVPTITYCLIKNSSDVYELHVTDSTDVYDATDNTTGWEDASTIEASNLTEANLTVTDPSGSSTIINVLSQIPDPVTGQITFTELGVGNGITIIDGYYKVLYTVKTASTTYTACVEKYFYPSVKCCISKFVKLVQEHPKNDEYYKDLLKAKAWEKALSSAASTVDKAKADEILALLTDFCKYSPCGCN